MLASNTDFFSYGTVNIYDNNNVPVSSFNTSISPGKIVFDIRSMSVNISEISLQNILEGSVYDIFGRRINSLENISQGIYIVNGKKIYLKE